MTRKAAYPLIDVFAGPGGLGEGFSSLTRGKKDACFRSAISIEQDEFAHRTLLLRHFLKSFKGGVLPEDYYRYLKGNITLSELYELHPNEKAHAECSAIRISLGADNQKCVRKLISERLQNQKKWALVGGPPCQAYSLVGRSRMMGDPEFENDERHFLYKEYLRIIIDHAPPVFVMENVKGLLSARVNGELVIKRITADLASPKDALGMSSNGLGYRLYSLSEDELPGIEADPRIFLVRAEEYGVPQARHRMFIVGVRKDISIRPERLKPHKPPTLKQTIGNLPKIRSGISRGGDSYDKWYREIEGLDPATVCREMNGHEYASDLMELMGIDLERPLKGLEKSSSKYPARPRLSHDVLDSIYDEQLSVLDSHESRSHMPSDLRRYAFAASFASVTGKSPKLADFPRSLLPDHANVEDGRAGKMFSDRFRVQLPDQPSTTVTSHISKDGHYFIHYDPRQCRSLTVREAARLQTFPDNYRFEGPRTSQYHQVGNAVPPYLARQIAAIIADVLDQMKDGDA
ncbi:DNA cytosine methyltransferase [Puniceibacterium sediminis]|uniref:DNA (cytosine-5-)-methyltransferase n=1 Tax=Puniceibacterium sediminis TaxID=1608407 RepID=A0A238VLQ9_9RHOB|nr:DNA cytosine methyltransferase [Puniceibacterium sediminis]SNR35166.1 DNA (cytosine-5)-methyltransferase 1 [Puniceibacterium sediminis]